MQTSRHPNWTDSTSFRMRLHSLEIFELNCTFTTSFGVFDALVFKEKKTAFRELKCRYSSNSKISYIRLDLTRKGEDSFETTISRRFGPTCRARTERKLVLRKQILRHILVDFFRFRTLCARVHATTIFTCTFWQVRTRNIMISSFPIFNIGS